MNSTRIVIGLTGLYCSGKSFIESIFIENGYQTIDLDRIGHIALNKQKSIIAERFGNHIITDDGMINRKVLGNMVFGNKNKLALLNSIVHPVMIEMVNDIIRNSSKKVIINGALLFELGLHKLCKQILNVKSSFFRLVLRGIKRDNRSIINILRIIMSQKVNKLVKTNKKFVEIVTVWNNDREKTRESVIKIIDSLGGISL